MAAAIASKFSEAYQVELTVEVVAKIGGQDHRFRIDALRDFHTGNYSTRAYIAFDATLQDAFKSRGTLDDREIWVLYDLPWTHRSTANDAVVQALSFLNDRQN